MLFLVFRLLDMAKQQKDSDNIGPSPGEGKADINKARYFLSRWLGNRQEVLGENMGTTDQKKISLEAMRQFNSMYGSDYIGPGPFNLDGMYPSGTAASSFHKSVIMRSVNDPFTSGAYTKTESEGTGEEYRTVRVGKDNQSLAVHESAHSMESKPQERKIGEIVEKYGASKDSYLDSAGEIHSRLMEFRHDRGLDPKKRYTLDDVKEMRKKYDDKKMLSRYSDEMMLELLNDVASLDRVDGSVRNA